MLAKDSVSVCYGGGKSLLLPFFTWGCISLILFRPSITSIIDCLLLKGTFSSNLPLWFLLTLFNVKVIDSIFSGIRSKLPIIILAIIGFIVANLGHYLDIQTPFWIFNTSSALFFFEYGKANIKIPLAIMIVLLAICLIFGYPVVDMFSNTVVNGEYCLWFISMIAVCGLFIRIGQLHNKPIPILSWIGRNSLIIFCSHWIVLQLLKMIINYIR